MAISKFATNVAACRSLGICCFVRRVLLPIKDEKLNCNYKSQLIFGQPDDK